MKVGIIGAGHIGGNCARLIARAGHQLMLSYSRTPQRLADLAAELGGDRVAEVVDVDEAVTRTDLVVLSVPWAQVDDVITRAGSFAGRVVVDTTNQFSGSGTVDLGGHTAARVNCDRLTGALYTKSFNTLTAGFQAAAASRPPAERVVQWLCGQDLDAKDVVAGMIREMGYDPVDLGNVDDCAVMEAPRRTGAVYGEEYRRSDAARVLEALQSGLPIPAPPHY